METERNIAMLKNTIKENQELQVRYQIIQI